MKTVKLAMLIASIYCSAVVSGQTSNGHAYVDLDLSVKWATCNVGANSPEGYGSYYQWGQEDVARISWGGKWRMPTETEFEELFDEDNCVSTWTSLNGVNGYRVKSKKNGNSIFLPAAGCRMSEETGERIFEPSHADGCYWSSTPGEVGLTAIALDFDTDDYIIFGKPTFFWFTIRPVCE